MDLKSIFKRDKQTVPGPYDLRNHPNAIKLADSLRTEAAKRIVLELKQQTQQLTQKDITKWRSANQYAINIENPKRTELYNIFDDAMLDLHLKGAIRNRKLKVLGSPFKIVDAEGNENDDLSKLLKGSWFRKFMNLTMDAKFYGYSLIQFEDIIREGKLRFRDVTLVPRRHVCPEFHVLLKETGDDPKKGFDYIVPPYSVWSIGVGDPYDLGELNAVAKETISKKYTLQFWDRFSEIFGIPIRVAKSSSRDKKDLDKIEAALDDMGSAFYALFPEGTTIELIENKNSDSWMVFDKRVDRANKEMSKAILGQTMTMDDGSSKSQALVHENVADEVAQDDMTFIADVINDQLIPFLNVHGFNLGDNQFTWDDTYEYSPTEMREIEAMIIAEYEVDAQYFIDKYGIPITGRKQTFTFEDPAEQDPQKKKLISSRPFIKLVNDFYHPSCPHCGSHSPFEGGQGDVLITLASNPDKEAERIAKAIYDGELIAGDIDPKLLKLVIEKLREALIKGYRKDFSKIDYDTPDWKMLQNLETNVYHFSAAKNYQELKELTTLLKDGDKIRPFAEFLTEVKKIHSVFNVTWLQTEYSTARNSAATASRWTEYQSNKKVMPYLKYQTAGDERVRESHQALDEVVRKIDDPFWKTYYPPNGWNCRCTVIQLPDQHAEETDMNKVSVPEVIPMFRTNLARTGVAFPPDHPYYDMPSKDSKKVFDEADKIKPDRSKK